MSTKNNNTHYETTQQLVSRKTGNPVKLLPDTSRMFSKEIYCETVNYEILNKNEVMIVFTYDDYTEIPF